MDKFTFKSFLGRLVAAVVLVFVTFNPSGYSYSHWIAHAFPKLDPVQVIAGLILLTGWIVFVAATLRSIGVLGVALVAVLFAALTWLMVWMGWIALGSRHIVGWIALIALAVTLAIGMSWSFVNRRLTGQVDVDESDNK